ncbi:tRNA lysidine(34) synthetase TilS [Marinobacter sp. 2_MG-2023]|uniref:tRNA lysidine(34) synthetase TilS n=1 Tax=Marinobacter sp. 2_MG-2023 TaxID=3062679 RepID=UPI0026E23856|nr:tRNA lysidine(34) synthetase TilS [Marinobacter sp. 2_MG-2023]MDO6443994.1 tRNA lysidine(34) synthetase TilS [Marinobacter sp. 2_MG-2023]
MTTGAKPLTGFAFSETLSTPVKAVSGYRRLWVALSGGLDSTLLLHLASLYHSKVRAVHINHQLQVNAGTTEGFCRDLCSRLAVPLTVIPVSVNLSGGPGEGLEEAARKARYEAFEALLEPGDILLMAHHADDQAETILFRMFRGSGVAGLAGMPRRRVLGDGQLVRPLLNVERSELEGQARQAGISWVEDPSNTDQKFDRNFLRLSILPLLKKRWQGFNQRLRHTAGACSDSDFLNQRLAELHWQMLGAHRYRLPVPELSKLALAEQKNLLRWWIRRAGYHPPSISDWSQVLHDLLQAAEDRAPELRAEGYSLQRFNRELYLVSDKPELPTQAVWLEPGQQVAWGEWKIHLESVATAKTDVPPIRICTRQGGERIRFHPDGPSKSLKKWLQEKAVPPWQRARLPLIFVGMAGPGELVGIGDLWCSEQYCGNAPAAGWRLIVERDCD